MALIRLYGLGESNCCCVLEAVTTAAMSTTDPPRRRRPPLSCCICRRRKLKCDREMPCGQCVKSKKPDDCVYSASVGEWREAAKAEGWEGPPFATEIDREPIQRGLHVFDSKNRVTKPSRQQRDDVQDLRGRVKALENALSRHSGSIRTPETLGDGSSDAGTRLENGVGEGIDSLPEHCFRGSNGRTRYVGRSNYALSMSVVSSSTQGGWYYMAGWLTRSAVQRCRGLLEWSSQGQSPSYRRDKHESTQSSGMVARTAGSPTSVSRACVQTGRDGSGTGCR